MFPACVAHLVDVARQLDATGLAPAADQHLRLDHHRVAELLGRGDGLVDREGDVAGRDRDAVAREELLALVLEEVHRYSLSRRSAQPRELSLPVVERLLQPLVMVRQRRTRREHPCHSGRGEGRGVVAGDDAPAEDHHVPMSRSPQQIHDAGEQREVGARQHRQADRVGILLEGGLRDLLRGLVQPGVDHLEAGVPQRPRDDLRPPVMAVQTGLRDHHAIAPPHPACTLASRTGPMPVRGPAGSVHCSFPAGADHNGPVAMSRARTGS